MSKTIIQNEDFFVIRTPRIPVSQLLSLHNDRESTRALILNWLKQEEVIEALYLATPSLLERIGYWKNKPDSPKSRKVEQTLLKYMIRMSSRPTPFGLFSGIHLGQVSSRTNLLSHTLEHDGRKTRLDMFYLFAIKEQLLKSNVRHDRLSYFPNPSHYFVAEQCRYIEVYQSKETRQYRLSAIEADEYFVFLLNEAKGGTSFNKLVNSFLINYTEANKVDVEAYVQALIDESVLLADIPIPFTGKLSNSALLNSLSNIGAINVVDHLSNVLHQLNKLDEVKLGKVEDYKNILQRLNQVPVKADEGKLFQADVYRSFETCQLNQEQVTTLINQLTLLKGLSHQSVDVFNDFITKFDERFEGQLVPLAQLLDDETGIGFSNETGYEAPLLAGLNIAKNKAKAVSSPLETTLDSLVTRAITAPENKNDTVIALKSKELKKHLSRTSCDDALPASFAVMISLYEDGCENLIIKLKGCYGPSAANLLGRFCHLNVDLEKKVKDHLEKEQKHSPEVVFAEIAHMPEGRGGNVIARPHLRRYEIVFMADSSLEERFQIPIHDLYVWVENHQVKLWSKRLKKQVVPRLSSAHNYSSRSLSIYKFLSMIQKQSGWTPSFNLPSSYAQASFVPRIMLDNMVLSEKTWRIPRKELESVMDKTEINYNKLTQLQKTYQLDDNVSYAVNDNVLQLNLKNPLMFEILLAESKSIIIVELKEVLIAQYQTPVKSNNGEYYNNELIIPLFNPGAKVHYTMKENPQSNIEGKAIKRRFSPGSEWLSLKIYSGNSSVESILTEKLLPLINASVSDYHKWFFIRYGDPSWHLRLRFNGLPNELCGNLLPKINQILSPMVDSGQIHKIELSTYEREVERYGGPKSMGLVESLFMVDSQLIVKSILLTQDYGEEIRWRITLLVSDKLLDLFEYNIDDKLRLISNLRAGFGQEFNESSTLRKQLGNKYREIEVLLKEDFDKFTDQLGNELSSSQIAIFSLVNQWQQHATDFVDKLNKIYSSEADLHCSQDSLLSSLLHMHNNRMFKAYGREQEFVMHDILRRYYFSNGKTTGSKKC
jgi:thiopeptide-type bacteriocin biosynthesis protein